MTPFTRGFNPVAKRRFRQRPDVRHDTLDYKAQGIIVHLCNHRLAHGLLATLQ